MKVGVNDIFYRYRYLMIGVFFLFSSAQLFASGNDIEVIRNRVINEFKSQLPDDAEVKKLVNTIRKDGSWPGIDYVDLSRTGFQHTVHVRNIQKLSVAYSNQESSFFNKKALKKTILSAIDYWLEHDFAAANWHTNEISNPTVWVCVLLLMEESLSEDQIRELSRMAGRANLEAWGARPGGDLIKIAGIKAKLALFQRDEGSFITAIEVMEAEIKITSGRGIKPDLSFHHRTDRVTSILAYGISYANTFAHWAVLLEGTRYGFSESSANLLIDYYLDGICKSMVHAHYKDPGVLNRSIASQSALKPLNSDIPKKLLSISNYRSNELQSIVKIREGEMKPDMMASKFFWLSEYYSHQRPGFFSSVRMFSERNYNMEYPHNQTSIKHHHNADGANFISRTGKEYYDIFPVWDWQKIPGTTVVQKKSLPGVNQIVKQGKTDFVGAVTDGKYGAVAFDFDSPHDPLKARKSWFFFDTEYVCLGAGIQSDSDFPVFTALNQCLLNGDVVAQMDGQQVNLTKGEHRLGKVGWVHHDSIGYIFPSAENVSLNNRDYTGTWKSIENQTGVSESVVSKELFSLWVDHGHKPESSTYEYIVVPDVGLNEFEQSQNNQGVRIISNTNKIQAVQQQESGITQIVFYEPGSVEWAKDKNITFSETGLVMIETTGDKINKITVADPSRKLDSFNFSINTRFTGVDSTWKAVWHEEEKLSRVTVNLPSGVYKGKSLVMRNDDEDPDYSLFKRRDQFGSAMESDETQDNNKYYIGKEYGGGIIVWLDESGDHGLIVSLSDNSESIRWNNGPSEASQHLGDHGATVTNARGDGVFAGIMNSVLQVAQHTEDNISGNFAAKVCLECKNGGYGDWYLPSKMELDLIYQQKDLVGGFMNKMYWSSTEYNVGFSWGQIFGAYGEQFTDGKGNSHAVRCVRRF